MYAVSFTGALLDAIWRPLAPELLKQCPGCLKSEHEANNHKHNY